jgi:hypothetical protein
MHDLLGIGLSVSIREHYSCERYTINCCFFSFSSKKDYNLNQGIHSKFGLLFPTKKFGLNLWTI